MLNVVGEKVMTMGNVMVIHSKLIPPIPQSTYMRRSSFNMKMNKALDYKLTLIHSGPGYGKSLGLAQFFRDQNGLYSWYTVTEEDDDIIPFLTYLIASVRRVIPSFGTSIEHVITPSIFVSDEEIQQWSALFINELCVFTDSLTMIIDDFHLVDHVFQINMFMERLVELLPPHVRIIISGRSRPKWSNLLKLQLNNQLYELTKKDFIFSEEEIIVYLEDYFDIELDDQRAKEIVRLTEGWAIAINLLAVQWSEMDSITEKINPVFQNLFDYLSEEVFQRRTEREQEWLLAFAIFPTFSLELINEFYGKEGVIQLEKIATEHPFIHSLGDNDSFRYHALFHQFLTNKWLTNHREKYEELNKKATEYYFKKGNHFQATYHATLTKNNQFLGEILKKTAHSIIRSGQFDWFLEVFEKLDEQVTDQYYELYYYKGEVHRYRAYYEQSRQAYMRCLEHAERNNDAYYISLANAGIAHIYLDTIQPALAESYLKKAIQWSQVSKQMPDKEVALLKRQFAENLVNLGRAKDATEWVKSERLPADILREGNLDARMLLRMGKLSDAKEILIGHMERKAKVPDSHREVKVLLSLIDAMTGQIEDAIANAEEGIRIGQEMKSRFVEAVGYTRRGHAEVIAYPYEIEKAENSFLKAIELMEQVDVSRGKAEPYMGLVAVKARQGLYDEAIKYGNYGLRETENVNDGWLSGLIHISLGIVYFYQQNYQMSEKHLFNAVELFIECGDLYHEMISHFWLMNIYYQQDQKEKLIESANKFINICVAENYQYYVTNDTLFGPFDRHIIYPIFHYLKAFLCDSENFNKLTSLIQLEQYDGHPGYQLYVKKFGRLKISIGSQFGPELQWQREKAKEMFLYFLFHKDRFIPKEEIMQVLWGEVEEKTADRNFKVTLNALLKALEPDREARKPSYFIIRKQKMYRLNPKATIISDRDLFLKHADQGLESEDVDKSIEFLLTALKFYEESPFEDMRDAEWLEQEKQNLERKYILVLEKLAQQFIKIADYQNAVHYAEKLLKKDPTWEEAYRLLMLAYFKMKNRPQSIKWYERCVEVLKKELNIEPMRATTDLYKKIKYQDEF